MAKGRGGRVRSGWAGVRNRDLETVEEHVKACYDCRQRHLECARLKNLRILWDLKGLRERRISARARSKDS